MFIKLAKVRKQEFLIALGAVLGIYLFGNIMFEIIMRVSAEDTAFDFGSFIAIIGYFIIEILLGMLSFSQDFSMAINMNRTRKSFFVSYLIQNIVMHSVITAVILGLHQVELWKLKVLYTGVPLDSFAGNIYNPKIYIALILGVAILQVALGAFIVRFGKKAYWVCWCIYMLLCVGGPRIMSAVADNKKSIAGQIGRALIQMTQNIPVTVLPIVLSGFGVLFIIVAWLVIRKQQSTN